MDGKPLRFATRHFGCFNPPAAPGAFAGDCSASRAGLWGSKIGRVRRQPCARPSPGFDKTKSSQKKNSLDSGNRPNYHRQCCSTIRGRESRTMEGSWAMAHGTCSATMDAENQPRGEVDADSTAADPRFVRPGRTVRDRTQARAPPGQPTPSRLRRRHRALILCSAQRSHCCRTRQRTGCGLPACASRSGLSLRPVSSVHPRKRPQ